MSKSNGRGRPSTKELQKRREEEREKQEAAKERQAALQQAFNADGQLSEGFIETIVSQEDLEVGSPDNVADENIVHTRTVAKLQNMLSRDWVLGNTTSAQEHDARHKLEVIKLKIIGSYPPADSLVQGEVRAELLDDPEENLTALTAQERILIDELIETLKTRIGRGRDGFERTQQNTSINRAETDRDNSSEDDGRWGGLFT